MVAGSRTGISLSGVSMNISTSGKSSAMGHTTQKTIVSLANINGYGVAGTMAGTLVNSYIIHSSRCFVADIFAKDTVDVALNCLIAVRHQRGPLSQSRQDQARPESMRADRVFGTSTRKSPGDGELLLSRGVACIGLATTSSESPTAPNRAATVLVSRFLLPSSALLTTA